MTARHLEAQIVGDEHENAIVGSAAGTASIPLGAGVHLWAAWSVAWVNSMEDSRRSTTT